MREFPIESPHLQRYPWPCAKEFEGFSQSFKEFLKLDVDAQRAKLREMRTDAEHHSEFVHKNLAQIYAYLFGYHDGACYLHPDDEVELRLTQAKLQLERELLNYSLPLLNEPVETNQEEFAGLLRDLVVNNPSVDHPIFDFIETEIGRDAMGTFLLNEVVRNEIVDDEVALLVPGHQGLMKAAAATNDWDECGRGKLEHFHTYWLRMLLEELPDGWGSLVRYRDGDRPWFSGVTSNVFAMLLTRPSFKRGAYGHFIITEGWVEPHFRKILAGMARLGMANGRSDIYFTAHVKLDPTHTEELIVAIQNQVPRLSNVEMGQILWGANLAIAGATLQYGRMQQYLSSLAG